MNYTDDVISFIQDYDNGSMWDEFVVAFEDVDDEDLDASDIIEWMQNYPDMYDEFLTADDDYDDSDDVYEALNRAHKLGEAASAATNSRTRVIPGTIYKVMIKGTDEFLLTECFEDIQAYFVQYARSVPSFRAVIYTMTNFRFKSVPYLSYRGSCYLNIDFSDSTTQSVTYVDGVCKTLLRSENYPTPTKSHLEDYTVRLTNDIEEFGNESLIVISRIENFKYKVVVDSVIHLYLLLFSEISSKV